MTSRGFFGSCLFLTHFITIYHFLFSDTEGVLVDLIQNDNQVCWPLIPCHAFKNQIYSYAPAVNWILGLVALAGALACVFSMSRKLIVGLSLTGLALKYLVIMSDLTLSGNFHYVTLIGWFCFLVFESSYYYFRFGLVAFYFSAAMVKLNPEWLSGDILTQQLVSLRPELWFKYASILGPIVAFASGLNIILEAFVSFFLLSENNRIRFIGLFFFGVFHLISLPVVGVTFPSIMFLLLAPLLVPIESPKIKVFGPMLFGAVLVLQLPAKILNQDPALFGSARHYSINMLDSAVECRNFSFVKLAGSVWLDFSGLRTELGPRLKCDALVNLEYQSKFCRQKDSEQILESYHQLFSRRSHSFHPLLVSQRENLCKI